MHRRRRWPPLAIAAGLSMGAGVAWGATFSWKGLGSDNNWTTTANWVPSEAPGAGDDVNINDPTPRDQVDQDDTALSGLNAIRTLYLGPGMNLTLQEDLTARTSVTIVGTVTVFTTTAVKTLEYGNLLVLGDETATTLTIGDAIITGL